MAMIFVSCLDVEVTTILNKDGSLDRIVEVSSDDSLKNYEDLPFPIDSTWKISYTYDSTRSKKKHVYSFKKHFKNAQEISKEYSDKENSLSVLDRKVIVEKKFRWFYTYITFEERYNKAVNGNYRPFAQYLSQIELEARKYNRGDSLDLDFNEKEVQGYLKDIETKFDKWFEDNVKEEILLVMEKDIQSIGIKGISLEDLKTNSDTIFNLIELFNFFEGDKDAESFYNSLNQIFNTEKFNELVNNQHSHLEQFLNKFENIVAKRGFKYNLQIPGLLLDTNAESIKGSSLSWNFEPMEAFFVDTSHSAESRIINLWAYIVSGITIVLILIFLLIPLFRNRK